MNDTSRNTNDEFEDFDMFGDFAGEVEVTPEGKALPKMKLYSGGSFDFHNMRAADFNPIDIAHSLSYLPRFNGHTNVFFSEAQHALLVSDILPVDLSFNGLLCNASKAYVGTSPVFRMLEESMRIRTDVGDAICDAYNLPHMPEQVAAAENLATAIEMRDLMGIEAKGIDIPDLPYFQKKLVPMTLEEAKQKYLERFKGFLTKDQKLMEELQRIFDAVWSK